MNTNEYDANYTASQIKKARNYYQYSQEEIAILIKKHCGILITPQTVSHWEKGNRKPNIHQLAALATIFDKDMNFFFENKEFHDSGKPNNKSIFKFYSKKSTSVNFVETTVSKELFSILAECLFSKTIANISVIKDTGITTAIHEYEKIHTNFLLINTKMSLSSIKDECDRKLEKLDNDENSLLLFDDAYLLSEELIHGVINLYSDYCSIAFIQKIDNKINMIGDEFLVGDIQYNDLQNIIKKSNPSLSASEINFICIKSDLVLKKIINLSRKINDVYKKKKVTIREIAKVMNF